MDGKAGRYDGAGAEAFDIRFAPAHPAPLVGAEGVDGLAGEVVMLEESEDRHRHRPPVVGIAEVDFIIPVQRLRPGLQFRPGVRLLVLLGLGDAGVIIGGVRVLHLDFEEGGTGEPVDGPGGQLGVADGDGFQLPAEVVFIRPGKIGDQCSHL